MAKVYFVRGPLRRQEITLGPAGLSLGRAAGNDVILPDDSVSRRHARFFQEGSGWAVADLGSLNGIRVNGEQVRQRPLMDRDVVMIGRSDIAFLEHDDSEFSYEDRTGELRRALRERYAIERQLGSGAQADVYAATNAAGRPCAIKVLTHPGESGTGDVRRFVREARALMALRHPNIVEIVEVDEAAGFNFMALEFLGGGSLEERIDKHGRMAWRDGLRLLAELARALVHAHARGIYHRDIKPANILFRDDGAAVLTDFGIAQILETTRLTRTGMVFGTPYFMSPGRLAGEPASDCSDVYALGATAYVAVTSIYPFPGAEVDDIIRAMKMGEATPARLLEPTVPRAVSDILERMLRRSAPDRIESAGELLRELEQLPTELEDGPDSEDRRGGAFRARSFSYLTDIGLTYHGEPLDGGPPVWMKVVPPAVAGAAGFEPRLESLRLATRCQIVPRTPAPVLLLPARRGRTLYEIHGQLRMREGIGLSLSIAIGARAAAWLGGTSLPHGDLHPQMLQIGEDGTIELLDPSFATLVDEASYASSRRVASRLPYAAPELLMGMPPTIAADVYALGALLFWLVTGRPAIEPGPQVERVERVLAGSIRYDHLETAGSPPELIELVRSMLAGNAARRPAPGDLAVTLVEAPFDRHALTDAVVAEFGLDPRAVKDRLAGA